MAKPIMISDENYGILSTMRKKKRGEKDYESYNDVITRLLIETGRKPACASTS